MRRETTIAILRILLLGCLLPAEAAATPLRDSASTIGRDTVPLSYTIPNVTIETARTRYSRVGNPAVELVRGVAEDEQARRDTLLGGYRMRGADRLTLSLANFDLNARWLHRLFPFFPKYVSCSRIDGRPVLPLSIRDRVSDYAISPADHKRREVIRYSRHTGVDQTLDDGTMTVALEELFPETDLYDRDVRLLNTHFPGPLSVEGLSRYKYYLTDTVVLRGRVAQTVTFLPFSPGDPAFRGMLYFTVGSAPRLLRSEMTVPGEANLNFVDALRLTQDYDPSLPDRRRVREETLSLSFRLYWRLLSFYAEQTRRYSDHRRISPDSPIAPQDSALYCSPLEITNLAGAPGASAYAPETERMLASDRGLKDFLEEVKAIPLYRALFDVADMVSLGYIRTSYDRSRLFGGSRFDIGPIRYLAGVNEVEGLRLRLGGRTTGFVSPRFFLEGYLAYGFRDRELKHSVTAAWSFLPKGYFLEEFPRDELRLTHSYDLYTPGRIYDSSPEENSLARYGTPYLSNRSYRNLWQLQYLHDYGTTLSLRLYLRHITDRPAEQGFPYLRVRRDGTLERQWSITDASAGVELRWAPGERIRPGSMERYSPFRTLIRREYPVLYLTHETAGKVLGGEYVRHRTELRIEHRLSLLSWGRLDYRAAAGKLWSAVPFPLLYTPPTNRGPILYDNGFKVLYPQEYVGDEWATLFAQWHMRGLVLNRIPGVSRLGLRGVWSLHYLYGNTSRRNQQAYAQDVFILPTLSTEMHHLSYVEMGFGLENIFKAGRIDLYRRLTPAGAYSQPSPWAVRVSLRVDF